MTYRQVGATHCFLFTIHVTMPTFKTVNLRLSYDFCLLSKCELQHGRRSWGWGYWPLKICRMGQRMFWSSKNVTFLHSILMLVNPANFTSLRMKDLCQKWKVKLIFRGAWNSLISWPDWPWPLHMLTTGLRHWATAQWRRPVVNIWRGQGQSGQLIKLFQAPRKISFTFHFW